MTRSDRTTPPRRRRWRRLAIFMVVTAVVAAAWIGVQAWLVAGDLQSARTAAAEVSSDLSAGQTRGIDDEVDRLREHARAAADRTDSLTWRALEILPLVGDDADAVARLASAVDVVARESVAPLVDTGLDPKTFTPRDGRVPLRPIEDAAPALIRSADGLSAALAELEGADREGLLDALGARYDEALSEVARADRVVSTAARGANLLPAMLGSQERRTYLVVFQNSAEVRSLGGMPGMVATLTAERGKLTMGETVPVSSFSSIEKPVLPLTPEEQKIWYDQPGTFFQDAVFIPDFPRASELMMARYARETGQEVDGVLSVDPAAMSYVVGASGGLTVDGVELTQDNFVDELVHRTYLRFPDDPDAEDAFFAAVAEAVFTDALDGGVDPTSLVDALTRGADEGRVLLHAAREGEQGELAGTRIAGELPTDPEGPVQVGVYANDSTGSKMSYFLRHDTALEVTSCERGATEIAGRSEVRSDTPEGVAALPETVTGPGYYGVPRGVQLVTFTLVGPVGGTIVDVEIDGEQTEEDLAVYRGRPVAKVPLWLEPGADLDLTWGMTSPAGGTDEVELRATPGVKSGGSVSRLTPGCGSR